MAAPTSVFAGLMQDEASSAGRGRNADAHAQSGVVLYRSDFDRGFDGWIDHWSAYRPALLISRTTEMQLRGSHSLMLSTGEQASPAANDWSNTATAFKRLVQWRGWRYYSVSAFIALGVGAYTNAWDSWQLQIDTQAMDDSHRSYFKVKCGVLSSPTWTGFKIRGDGGDTDFKTVTGANKQWQGDNDNKHNFGYIRLTVDMQANGGLGGYKELQVNQGVFDLTGLGAGSSTEPVQADGSNAITEFNGGFNIGLAITRNTAIADGCQLFADDIVVSASDTF